MTDPTNAAGLVELAKQIGVELAVDRAERLLAYLDAMLALNEQINLTAVREREAAVLLHALDGLAFGKTRLHPQQLLDLGSGNGFPGVAVACLHPAAAVVLMDRTGKKVRAIGAALLQAGLATVDTLQMDAAQAPGLRRDLRHAFDVVTARAVAAPEEVARLAAPLLRPRGHLVLWLDAAATAPTGLPDFRRSELLRYELPAPAARSRLLGVWQRNG